MDKVVSCRACEKEFLQSEQYAHYGGFYCSKECYSTLFEECQECHHMNMGAKTNRVRHGEQLCDPCYNKKHGLTVVTLIFGPFS